MQFDQPPKDELPSCYREKTVISGHIVEVYSYERAIWLGFPRLFNLPKRVKPQTEIRADNVLNTKRKLKRLINANSVKLTNFVLLTYRENQTDLAVANRQLHNFIQKKLKPYYDSLNLSDPFMYVCVPEFQKRGAVHYHLLCNLPFTDNAFLTDLWGHGFTFLKKIYDSANLGSYVSKYLTKANFDKRYFGKQKFFYSNNLKKPIVIYHEDSLLVDILAQCTTFIQKTLDFTIFSDFQGVVQYRQRIFIKPFLQVLPSFVLLE